MKKILSVLSFFCFCCANAQNVGIGTPTPTSKLQVNHRTLGASVGVKLVDSSNNSAGSVEFRHLDNPARMLLNGYYESNFHKDQYLDVTSDSIFVATFRGNGMVGIRTGTPQYPLHVNGDINTTGTVRVNGNAGASGQVLRSNGDGTMSWNDLSQYNNVATFRFTGAWNWVVPAGVTRIAIEVWGAGGGGTAYSGGGGGGYIRGFFTVTPGINITMSIGIGGAGAHDNASNGDATSATVPGVLTLNAQGGFGATYTAASLNVAGGSGGGYSVSNINFLNFVGEQGKPGSHSTSTFIQSGSTTFLELTQGANGGSAGNTFNTGGIGSSLLFNATTSTTVRRKSQNIAIQPGGGGPGGYFIISPASLFGNGGNGADGMVIIRY